MDSDEWDDDIADEDLLKALTQMSRSALTTASRGAELPGGGGTSSEYNLGLDLDGLPPGAFESSPDGPPTKAPTITHPQRTGSSQSLRHVNFWGQAVVRDETPRLRIQSKRVYRADMPSESPTQHKLDHDALKTWVYPTNLGPTRDYQFSIVKNGLFNNTLVALPTGLGKTFIAATVMLNYYRWTKDAKIIFVAPTKPLASQQVEACLNVAGIPRSEATLLTGEIPPSLREVEWGEKRLFFMTPQTLINDLSKGYADPKSVVLLVIDEAHRAIGDYAYVKVVEFLRRFNQSFRVLALTATPGSTVEGVQAVIDSLGISTIEIRTEESIDIRQYVHSREIDQILLEPSDEMLHIQGLLSKTLRPLCGKLAHVNKWLARDPMALTVMGLREGQRQWLLGPGRHANPGTKGMLMVVFTILQSLAHSIKLLNFHGIAPFYHKMLDFRSDVETQGSKGSKYRKQVVEDESFKEMMNTMAKWQKMDGFVGHPKLAYLCKTLHNHFKNAGIVSSTRASSTRAIVFSEYRDSAEEIVRVLNKHEPMIKASIFVGQADSKRSEGMKQKQQIETIENFRKGGFNVLVATSIGEEGLDIGQVDLIVCYDASGSPIRMLQRMGRTGRKRAGNITLLLMKGKEEDAFKKAKDNYEKMQRFICEGTRFNFRKDLSSRIVPRDARPEVDMRLMEIPIENTQNLSLPEPKKGGARRKKATHKKFHMPDGVITGFMKASTFGRSGCAPATSKPRAPVESDVLADIPPLGSVNLNTADTAELDHIYRNLPSLRTSQEDISGPDLAAQPKAQRQLSPVVLLKHGAHTKRCVKLFRILATSQSLLERHIRPYSEELRLQYIETPAPKFADDTEEDDHATDLGFVPGKRSRDSPTGIDGDDELPPKRQRKRPEDKPKAASQQFKSRNPFIDARDRDKNENGSTTAEDDEDDDAQAASKQSMTKSRPRKNTAKPRRNNNALEDFGDDCTRTSQLVDSDGSDDGADLVDFIDDGPMSYMHDLSSATLASPPAAARSLTTKQQGATEAPAAPFYEFHLTQSQDSDRDLVSMSQLGPMKKTSMARGRWNTLNLDADSDEDFVEALPAVTVRRRQAVVVDESD